MSARLDLSTRFFDATPLLLLCQFLQVPVMIERPVPVSCVCSCLVDTCAVCLCMLGRDCCCLLHVLRPSCLLPAAALQVPTYVDKLVPVEVQREQPRVRKAQQHPSHLGTDWEPCFRSLQPVIMPAQQHLLVATVLIQSGQALSCQL